MALFASGIARRRNSLKKTVTSPYLRVHHRHRNGSPAGGLPFVKAVAASASGIKVGTLLSDLWPTTTPAKPSQISSVR